MALHIHYEDDDLIVVEKPPGLLCVPGLSDPDNLHQRVLNHNANARVVHRLDMATSGMVIFALNYESQKALSRMFEQKQINKRYCAVVAGRIEHDHGEIISPLICDWDFRPKQKVDWVNGKLSQTHYQPLERTHQTTRVQLIPITGRTHQLRVHMEQIGHPILGDKLYSYPGLNDGYDRLHLHAERLEFTHPISGSDIRLRSQPLF